LLSKEAHDFVYLEVAHILPHSLMKIKTHSQLNSSQQAAMILNMFDSGVVQLIEGTDIDRPRNAITLTHSLHRWFGNFLMFFTPTEDQRPHTYKIEALLPSMIVPISSPITRTLYLTETRTIDPPLPRLLGIHRAIAHILHLSAAGDYIDKILLDLEQSNVRADGSTELGRLLKLRLDFGVNDTVEAY